MVKIFRDLYRRRFIILDPFLVRPRDKNPLFRIALSFVPVNVPLVILIDFFYNQKLGFILYKIHKN